jgi:carbon-monoxide dehydrogenase large subunit
VKEQWHTSIGAASPETPRPPLAEGEVRFAGDPVVLVVADTRARAEDAAEFVEIDYEPLPAVIDYTEAEHADVLVHEGHGSNVIGELNGLPASALEGRAATSRGKQLPAYAPVPDEGRGCRRLRPRPAIDDLRSDADAAGAAVLLRLLFPEHHPRYCATRVAASPEGHGQARRDVPAAFVRRSAREVVEDRREPARGGQVPRARRCQMAFDADGAIQAAYIDFVSDCGAYPTPWPVGPAAAVGMLFPGPYRVPRAGFATKSVYTNTVGRTAYRGPWQFETLAREVLLDIAARQMRMDPVDLRRRNLLRPDDLPYANANGMPYDRITPLETFEQALAMLDYEAFRTEQAEARAVGRYLGVGVSAYVEPSTPGYGVYGSEAATIRIEPSGVVNVYVAGVPRATASDDRRPAHRRALGGRSRTSTRSATPVTGFSGCGRPERPMTAGGARPNDDPARIARSPRTSWKPRSRTSSSATAARMGAKGCRRHHLRRARCARVLQPAALPRTRPGSKRARYTSDTPIVWVNATHVCTCEVDVTTGRVRLLRYIVSEDWRPDDPPERRPGQIAAAPGHRRRAVRRVGLRGRQPARATFMDYLLPTARHPDDQYGTSRRRARRAATKASVKGRHRRRRPSSTVADALAPFGVLPPAADTVAHRRLSISPQ